MSVFLQRDNLGKTLKIYERAVFLKFISFFVHLVGILFLIPNYVLVQLLFIFEPLLRPSRRTLENLEDILSIDAKFHLLLRLDKEDGRLNRVLLGGRDDQIFVQKNLAQHKKVSALLA